MAFHPQLSTEPYLYTYYSSAGCSAPNVARCSILSRWTLNNINQVNNQLPSIDPNTELVLMEFHNLTLILMVVIFVLVMMVIFILV